MYSMSGATGCVKREQIEFITLLQIRQKRMPEKVRLRQKVV